MNKQDEFTPQVSIVIPVYKAEPYIRKCIESVLNQTYHNIQIVVVNDGSPDNSMKIVEEYKSQDARIVTIYKENGGVSSARNLGIQHARGKYIHFLDSDDYLELDACRKLVYLAEETKADIVRSIVLKEFENDSSKNELCSSKKKNDPFSKILYFQGLFIRIDIIKNNDIIFPPYKLAEDICFNYSVQAYSQRVVYLDEITYHWVQYKQPFNNRKYDDFKARKDMLLACQYLINHMLDNPREVLDSAVIGFVDHFITYEYDSQARFNREQLVVYRDILKEILSGGGTSYRLPNLYREYFKCLYGEVEGHIRYLKILPYNKGYYVFFQLKKLGIAGLIKKIRK